MIVFKTVQGKSPCYFVSAEKLQNANFSGSASFLSQAVGDFRDFPNRW